jgi:hypothetical protein
MDKILKSKIKDSMTLHLQSRNPFVACEAARILCAVEGIFCSESSSNIEKPSKVTAQKTVAKQFIFEELQRKGEARRNQNRKQYLKRKAKRNLQFQVQKELVPSEQEQRTQSEQEQPPTPAELAAFAESNNDRNAAATPQSLQAFLAGRRRFDKILADIASGRANEA